MESDSSRRNKKSKNRDNKKKNRKEALWTAKITMYTIIISGTASLLSESTLPKVDASLAFIILVLIIFLGVIFDIIGTAVTAANEVPFHAMAAKKVKAAKVAVKMIRNASKVSNFCNDVVGDVCGIISGSVGVVIVAKVLQVYQNRNEILIAAGISAMIAGATVGGKAIGKKFAITNSNKILYTVAKIVYFIK
ncbi:CNNM domain-containing protein [Clostridium sp.]|uniref:CNNM domain-containing protein n=1 Tax=Clostridium sp. TaxID=1506 RepID=UPI0032179A3C